MTDEKKDATEYMWKGEPCPNPEKGWITDSRDNRLTRLGNRNAFGKIIQAHNREVEIMHQRLSRAQPVADDAGGGERPREIWVDHTAEAFTDDVRISQGLTRYIRADVIRQPAAADNRGVDDVIAWADGIAGALGSEYAGRVTDKEQAIAMAIKYALLRTTPEDAKGWLPIETAPKDGKNILALYKEGHGDAVVIAHFDEATWAWWTDGGLDLYAVHGIDTPSAWMPLPAAPQPEHDKTGGES